MVQRFILEFSDLYTKKGFWIKMVTTNEQIRLFRGEAGMAGDLVAVAVCDLALNDELEVQLDEADAYKLEQLDLDHGDVPRQEAARKLVASWIEDAAAQGGRLLEYDTGRDLRAATAEEQRASREAARHDGGAGVIEVDGIRCYVED